MAKTLCPQCKAEYFETGYGVRRKVEGVWTQVGDLCAANSVKRDVESTIQFLEGLKREHPDLSWQELVDKAYRSRRRFLAWQSRFQEMPERVKGFLRLCDEDSTAIYRSALRLLIDQRLLQAESEMAKIGQVKVPIETSDEKAIKRLTARQRSLDRIRDRICLGIKTIHENLEKLDTRGLITGPGWWNLLRDTAAAATQLWLRIEAYAAGQEQADAYKAQRLLRLATQTIGAEAADSEAVETAGKPVQLSEEPPPVQPKKGGRRKKETS